MRTDHPCTAELRAVPALAGCEQADLLEVDARATELNLRAGRVLCHQGGKPREVVIVLEGRVAISRSHRLLRECGPGSVFGAAELRADQAHHATVVTTSDARILVMSGPDYADLQDAAPEAASGLAGTPVRRGADVVERVRWSMPVAGMAAGRSAPTPAG